MSASSPLLKIKKNADTDVVYHYNRDKRLSMVGAPSSAGCCGKGLFSRNPSIKLLLLDVFFIILMSFGARALYTLEREKGKIGGIVVEMETVTAGDKAFCSLDLSGIADTKEVPLIITFLPIPGDGIPVAASYRQYSGLIRQAIPITAETNRLQVTISFGEDELKLFSRLGKEK